MRRSMAALCARRTPTGITLKGGARSMRAVMANDACLISTMRIKAVWNECVHASRLSLNCPSSSGADTDNTLESGTAYYGDIVFKKVVP